MDSLLFDFFNRRYETSVNRQMMSLHYKLPKADVVAYINSLLAISFERYVDYVKNNLPIVTLTSYDVPQFSSWEDGTRKIRHVLMAAGDGGFVREAIGQLLRDDKKLRTDVANRKYGEGHAKLGTWMGLLYELAMTYYVSCLGYVVDELSEKDYCRLQTRLLMRMPFIQYLLQATQKGAVDVRAECLGIGLSEITCYRRHSNIMCVIDRFCSTDEADLREFRARIDIDSLIAKSAHCLDHRKRDIVK